MLDRATLRFVRHPGPRECGCDTGARSPRGHGAWGSLWRHTHWQGSASHRVHARGRVERRCPVKRRGRHRGGSRLHLDPRPGRRQLRARRHGPGREAEPTEENLAALRATVRACRADLGIAHDGDGDRMVAVDREGTFVGGDLLLALFARQEVRTGLVVPVDASMVLEDLLPKAKIWRTRVGDVYVAAEIKRRNADFGGEPSGTWIFPKATLCPDGVYAAARLVSMVVERPLDELVGEIPRYPVIRGAVAYSTEERAKVESRLDASLRGLSADLSTVDGWRLQFEDGWALVRFSGTEPKIRVLAESRDEARAKEIYSTVLSSARGAAA